MSKYSAGDYLGWWCDIKSPSVSPVCDLNRKNMVTSFQSSEEDMKVPGSGDSSGHRIQSKFGSHSEPRKYNTFSVVAF